LIGALADTKIQVAEVRELLLQKDGKILRLQDELKLQDDLIYEKPYYWVKTAGGNDGPYCQRCYNDRKKLIVNAGRRAKPRHAMVSDDACATLLSALPQQRASLAGTFQKPRRSW